MGRVDRATRFRVLAAANFTCQYCGRKAPEVVLEVDHAKPKASGGTGQRRNLIAACFDCNRGKRDRVFSTVIEPANPDLFPEWRMCCDSCLWCPVTAIGILPVTAKVGEGHGYVMTYRCQAGHQWQTWWSAGYARAHALGAIEEKIRTYPHIDELTRQIREEGWDE